MSADAGGSRDVADCAAAGVFAQAFLHGLGTLGQLDFLVVNDQDLFDQRPVLGDDDLVGLAFVVDDCLIDRDALFHVLADGFDFSQSTRPGGRCGLPKGNRSSLSSASSTARFISLSVPSSKTPIA